MTFHHQRRRPRTSASLALLTLLVVFFTALTGSAAASRIITRGKDRAVVAVSPGGGRPKVLFHLELGLVLGIGASADGDRIAVASRETRGHRQLDRVWLMDGNGRGAHVVRTFVDDPPSGHGPIDAIAVSPDGHRLLLTFRKAKAEAKVDAYLLRLDGTGMTRVPVAGGWAFACGIYCENYSGPQFTPDGKHILGTFSSSGLPSGRRGIGTVPLRGGRVHFVRIGLPGTLKGSGFAPTMSRDGRRIAFVVGDGRTPHTKLMIMRSNGSRAHPVRNGNLHGKALTNPSFSPSGRALAFAATELNRFGGTPGATVFVIRCDGSGRHLVERGTTDFYSQNPIWLP